MTTIVVEVMPKAELLDPQGKAVASALARTGKGGFSDVRVGKRFEIVTDEPVDDAMLAGVREIAEDILSNSVIEDVVAISVAESAAPPPVERAKGPTDSEDNPRSRAAF